MKSLVALFRNTLHRAFNLWASVSSLNFQELPDLHNTEANINIAFLKRKHGDNMPFDGPEGIVAHAFYPTLGILHFDADENWTLNQSNGINLYQTAVHEIGITFCLKFSNLNLCRTFAWIRTFNRQQIGYVSQT